MLERKRHITPFFSGYYAEFKLPAVPDLAQTTTIDSIDYAIGNSVRPKSNYTGIAACVGVTPPPDNVPLSQCLTMIEWMKRRFGFPPGLENADLRGELPRPS